MITPNETQPGLYFDLLDDRTREAVIAQRHLARMQRDNPARLAKLLKEWEANDV